MPKTKQPVDRVRQLGLQFVAIGVALIAGGVVVAFVVQPAQSPSIPLGAAVLGAFLLWLATRILRDGPSARQLSIAFERLSRGQLEEAEAVLDAIPLARRKHEVRRAYEIQRAMIAFRRKDTAGAIRHATHAIEGRPGLLALTGERTQVVGARAFRAVAAASADDSATAATDIAAVRGSPLATPSTLAQAALAEAIGFSRSNEREKLASLLTRERKLLLEFTSPRDRALVRALQRTLYLRSGAAYRDPAVPGEPSPESELAGWIAHLAPSAAGVQAPGAAFVARVVDSVPQPTAAAKNDDARAPPRRIVVGPQIGRGPALWGVLLVSFLGIYGFLKSGVHPPRRPSPIHALPVAFESPVLVTAIFLFLFAVLVTSARRGARRLRGATRLLALPDSGPAERAFTRLTKHYSPLIAAQAEWHLGAILGRRGSFAEALAAVDRGSARVAHNVGAELISSNLLAQRAHLLAALGRPDEALATLRMLETTHPTYPFLAGMQLTVRTLAAVRQGDLGTASALASQRTPDLTIGLYDEVLADMLLTTAEPKPVGVEVERLRDDLRLDADLRTWLQIVWPDGSRALEDAARRAG